jgi:hypothetical protein
MSVRVLKLWHLLEDENAIGIAVIPQIYTSRGSSVNTMNRLRPRKSENESLLYGRGRKFFPHRVQPDSRNHPPSNSVTRPTGLLSQGVKRPVVNLTSHHHLIARSRIRGAIPLLPHMSTWCSAKLSIGLSWTIQWIFSAFMKLWSAHCLCIQQILFRIWSHLFNFLPCLIL